jgi:O-antigen/teichoic acid export membrane protein
MAPAPTSGPDSTIDRSALDRLFVKAVGWTAVARWSSQVISWSALLINARLLSPADFGILSMTVLLTGFIAIFAEFGVGSAIIVMRELSPRQIRQTHAISVLLGLAGSAAAFLAAKPAAAFFQKPELISVVPLVSLGFVLAGFRVVPQALLARDLRFKTIAVIEACTALVNALASLLLAWLGLRYWSLVFGSLAAAGVSTILLYVIAPCGFARPVFHQVRAQLAYSQRLLISRAAWYLYSTADFMVAGRVLGGTALGVYNMAWNLASAPVERVVTLILRATPSVFARVQHDPVELKRYLRVVTEGMGLIVVPAGFGLALVAGPAVSALLDARWAGVAAPLRFLAMAAVLRCLFSVSSQVQTAIRDVGYGMWVSLISLVVFPPSFWFASRWGGEGIAAVWLCLYPILNIPPHLRTLRKIGMSKREYLGSLRPAGVAAAVMSGAVLGVRHFVHETGPLVELIAEAAVGGAVYLCIIFIFFRRRVEAFRGFILHRQSREASVPLSEPHSTCYK